MRKTILRAFALTLAGCLVPFVLFERFTYQRRSKPRLFFGATSIFVLPQLVEALRQEGFQAICGAVADVDFPVPRGFDRVVTVSASHNVFVRYVLGTLASMVAFVWAIRRADIFHHYMDGGFLRRTPLQMLEIRLLRLAKKKVILFPYGNDAWSLDRIPDPVLRTALLDDYPHLSESNESIAQRLDAFSSQADMVVGCLVHNMVLPKYDALMLTCYGVETDKLAASRLTAEDGPLRVFHAPNHRNCKGTSHLIDAIEQLRGEGQSIELSLVERVPRNAVLEKMKQAHVVVDQLLCGYGMTALEGMALGRIVISGENWPTALRPFLALQSYQDCPIHWASPATIAHVLRNIALNRGAWHSWSADSRRFVERYHSPKATAQAWAALYPKLGYPNSASTRL